MTDPDEVIRAAEEVTGVLESGEIGDGSGLSQARDR